MAKGKVEVTSASSTPAINDLQEIPQAQRGATADNFRRNLTITKLVHLEKMPVAEVARRAGISPSRVRQIAKQNYENRHWKLD